MDVSVVSGSLPTRPARTSTFWSIWLFRTELSYDLRAVLKGKRVQQKWPSGYKHRFRGHEDFFTIDPISLFTKTHIASLIPQDSINAILMSTFHKWRRQIVKRTMWHNDVLREHNSNSELPKSCLWQKSCLPCGQIVSRTRWKSEAEVRNI